MILSFASIARLVPLSLAFAVTTGVGVYSARRRAVDGALSFAVFSFSIASYTLGYILELLSPDLRGKLFWDNVQFIGMFGGISAFFVFTVKFTGLRILRSAQTLALLAVVPVVSLALVFTDTYHGLVRADAWIEPGTPFSELSYGFSPAFIAMFAYVTAVFALGAAVLLEKLVRSAGPFRAQVAVVLAGVLFPMAGGTLTMLGVRVSFHRDTAPFTFAAAGFVVAWGLFRFRLFDLVPSARGHLVDSMRDGMVVVDSKGRVVDVNRATLEDLGLSAREVIGREAAELFSQWSFLRERFEGFEEGSSEVTLETAKGRRWFDLSVSPLRDQRGALTGRVFVAHDCTDRKSVEEELKRYRENLEKTVGERTSELEREIRERRKAEESLRVSEEKYRLLVENATDAILVVQDGMMKYCNEKTCIVTGYGVGELLNRPFPSFIHAEDAAMVVDNYRRRLAGEDIPSMYSFRIVKKSGEPVWVEINAVRVTWEGKPSVLSFIRDISVQKRLEGQLLQAQKMDAIGTLAGGIAHDFNNLLQAILGYTQMLLHDREEGDPEREKLMEIETAALRAGELTERLLIFGRKVESKLRPVDLNREVRQAERLLMRTIPKMIRIELALAGDLRVINADPVQMGQLLMNLGINARDAMPEGGVLGIKTENVFLDEQFARLFPWAKPGSNVLLTVSDTGHGMSREVLEHLFEPFYTTKDRGKGTGLGLAMVYGVVKSHGGHIVCESAPDRGTTFRIYLPALRTGVTTREEPRDREAVRGGAETILVVDDEEAIRALASTMLAGCGYRVLTAPDGEGALELFRSNGNGVALVVLDLIMPGMGGKRCMAELRRIDPGVKILVSSGYAPDGMPADILEAGAKGLLQKPFQMDQFLSRVRAILDG